MGDDGAGGLLVGSFDESVPCVQHAEVAFGPVSQVFIGGIPGGVALVMLPAASWARSEEEPSIAVI